MDSRDIAGLIGVTNRTRVLLRAVALAAGFCAASGCLGQPGQDPADAAPSSPDAAPSSPDAAPAAPRFVQVAYAKASNAGASDYFGLSVAVAGDTIVASAPFEDSASTGIDGDQDDDSADRSGAVYAFRRGDAGWQQQAYIKPTFSRYDENSHGVVDFGYGVAMSGDTLAVAAPYDFSQGALDGGAVYVFRRSDTGWRHEALLHNPDVYSFGRSMALDGDTLAAFAPHTLPWDEVERSTLHVFRRSGTSWSEEASFPYPTRQYISAAALHDTSMALSGDTLVIGAHWDDSGANSSGAPYSGAVHVFRRSGTDWLEEARIKPSNTEAGDGFGISLALDGDTLVVGAYGEDSDATGIDGDQSDNTAPNSGAVYVFRRSGTGWQQEAYIKPSITETKDNFGYHLALDGDTLAVGSSARELDHPGQGVVYMFRRSDTGWQEEPHVVVASEPHESSGFGAMALEGDTLVIGAAVDGPDDARADLYESGAIYVFQRVRE